MIKRKKIPSPKVEKSKLSKIPILREEINFIRERKNEKILFSFLFFDRSHEAFNLGKVEINWYISLLDALKELNDLTRNELTNIQRHHWEAHSHDWDTLKYKYNFDDDFLEQVESLQIRISTSKGRIHGFIIGNRFYIVWLDPHHNLYPSKNHGGLKLYYGGKNECEVLKEENLKLKEENEILNELLKEYE